MAYDERTAERVRNVLSGRRDVVEKNLMGGLCFMVSGGMCCSVSSKGGLLIRVGAFAHERMLREPHVQPMKMGGRIMTGFVRVAPEGYRTDAALKKWIQRGLNFIATMPANPSRKKAVASPALRQRAGTRRALPPHRHASHGLKLVPVPMSSPGGPGLETTIAQFAAEPNGGLVVMPSFIAAALRPRIIRAAAQNRVPAIYGHRFFVAEGGLISYGTDIAQCFAQAASYIDRILKGETRPPTCRYSLPPGMIWSSISRD
jgi:hypothetical protein